MESREIDNERLRVINHEFKAKCAHQRAFLAAYKKPSSLAVGAAEDQAQNVNVKVAELQRLLNRQPLQVCYAQVRALVRKEWEPEIGMGASWLIH